MDKKPILYIIMRNDLLSMNPGKAMAQASHASAHLINKYHKPCMPTQEWIEEGSGFGTTVVLEGTGTNIKKFIKNVKEKIYVMATHNIIDKTYPFKAQKELLNLLKEFDEKNSDINKYQHFYTYHDLNIVNDNVDKFGMVSCTRIEHTCSYVFFYGTDDEQESFKNLCKEYNIELHR